MPSNGKLSKWLVRKAVVEPIEKKFVNPAKEKVAKSKIVGRLKEARPGSCVICGRDITDGRDTCGRVDCVKQRLRQYG